MGLKHSSTHTPRIQRILQPIPQEIKRDHGDENQDAGVERQGGCGPDEFLGVGEQVSPTGEWGLDAEA